MLPKASPTAAVRTFLSGLGQMETFLLEVELLRQTFEKVAALESTFH